MNRVVIYTDGGADPNPGDGGWGAVLLHPPSGECREISGGAAETTNNRMELTAAIQALRSLKQSCSVELYTDSTYLRGGITNWLPRWRAEGWKRRDGEPVKNVDLWQDLEREAGRHEVEWRWVKGHAGDEHNERADSLASQEIARRKRKGGATPTEESQGSAVDDSIDTIFLRVTRAPSGSAWAALVRRGKEETLRSGGGQKASANRLELRAALTLLSATGEGERWQFVTASDYLRNGAVRWLAQWRKNRWRTRGGDPVKHDDLWRKMARVLETREVIWPVVKKGESPELDELTRIAREKRLEGAARR